MNVDAIFIDDERSIRHAVSQALTLLGWTVACYDNAQEALKALDPNFGGVILSDINMPFMDGIEFLEHALNIDNELQVIMLTGHGDVSTAVNSMRKGAYDFLEKPFSNQHLIDVLTRARDKRRLILDNRNLRLELELQSQPGPRILGRSSGMLQCRRFLVDHLQTNHDILLLGDIGTGKKLAANFLQPDTQRLHIVQCDNMSAKEIISDWDDSESTLYLNRIDTLSHPELLVEWLASPTRRCRVIAASNRHEEALQATLEPSLYAHFAAHKLSLPALKARAEDIPLLFDHFCRATATRFGMNQRQLSAEELDQLYAYDWERNISELREVAERFTLLGQGLMFTPSQSDQDKLSLAAMVNQFERHVLTDSLIRHQGRLKEVQLELDLARKTLYDKLKKHHLDKTSYK